MRFSMRFGLAVGAIALASTLSFAQAGGAERQRLVDAVIARGDKALAAGNTHEARAAWSLVAGFDPANAVAKKKLGALPGGGGNFALSGDEQALSRDVISNNWGDEWCDFPQPLPAMEQVALRMSADTRLLPNLKTTTLSVPCRGSGTSGVLLFLAKPDLSIADVRQAYGQPQAEKKHGDGKGYESLTYGRFRVLGGKDGRVAAVLCPPFPK